MNTLLLLQIEKVHDSIAEKQNEHFALINNGCDYDTLQTINSNIEKLKKELHGLQELFLQQSRVKNNKFFEIKIIKATKQ